MTNHAKKPTLKPCPFCGGEGKIVRDSFGAYIVSCKICGAVSGNWHSKEDGAANIWNTRPQPTEAQIEAAAEAIHIAQNNRASNPWYRTKECTKEHKRYLAKAALLAAQEVGS